MVYRTKAKDALAWTIIYGGWAAVKLLIVSGSVAAGLIDKNSARMLSKTTAKIDRYNKKRIWERYQRTGDIWWSIFYSD